MPPSKILVDSSFLIAFYDRDFARHSDVSLIATIFQDRLVVPQVILTEVVYLLKRDFGIQSAATFLREFALTAPDLQEVTTEDLQRAAAIMEQYADADFDFVDCCIMALAERLNVTEICTLDQRDFSIFRPTHCPYLEVLP